jgi:hypothetical protein
MLGNLIKPSNVFRVLYLLIFMIIFSIPAQGQQANSEPSQDKDTTIKKRQHNKLDLYVEMDFEYLDNVYRLTEDQISDMKDAIGEDQTSGRFKDMDSVEDFIVQPVIGLKYDAKNPIGGKFDLTSWIKYDYYTKNDNSSFPEGRIRISNTIGKKGELTLQGDFVSGFFKKNYLSSVDDLDGNGNIPKVERIYSAATYDEYKGTISYEYDILKNKEKNISEFEIQPFMGIEKRTFNPIFSNRDKSTAFAGLGMTLEFISKIDLEMIYQHEAVSGSDEEELALFDETIAHLDVNGDGKIKSNAPLWTHIDRSCKINTIEINPTFQLNKKISLALGYKRSVTAYESDNRLDIDHFKNTTYRRQIKSEIDCKFNEEWSARFEYARVDDNDDEDGDYLQNLFLFTIKYNFLNSLND